MLFGCRGGRWLVGVQVGGDGLRLLRRRFRGGERDGEVGLGGGVRCLGGGVRSWKSRCGYGVGKGVLGLAPRKWDGVEKSCGVSADTRSASWETLFDLKGE